MDVANEEKEIKSLYLSRWNCNSGGGDWFICLFVDHRIRLHKTGHCGFLQSINGIQYCNVRYLYRINKYCILSWKQICEGGIWEICDPSRYLPTPPGGEL